MKYQAILQLREENDDDKAHRNWFTGDNYLLYLFGSRRTIGDPRRKQFRHQRRSRRRPPSDADELCRRRAEERSTMCCGRLLLGPADRWGEPGLDLAIPA